MTFGSFNNLAKVNGKVVALWAEVLRAVPRSRLLLKARAAATRPPSAICAARSRPPASTPSGSSSRAYAASARAHLEAYREVDVALDTFPYNGTTTTCEALWMGVPVVTLAGDRHAARVGASLLSAAGFPAGIAERPRTTSRPRACSPSSGSCWRRCAPICAPTWRARRLCDAAGHARALEEAYRAVWHIWCAGPPPDRHR